MIRAVLHPMRCTTPHRQHVTPVSPQHGALTCAGVCIRAQSLPLVCRRWREALTGPSAAWRTLHVDSSLMDPVCITSFFAFCSRTRCIEVGEDAYDT